MNYKIFFTLFMVYTALNAANFTELFQQANSLHYQQKFLESSELYRQAAHLNPTNPQVYFNLGVTLCYCNQTDQALDAFKKAVEYDPAYKKAYNFIVDILHTQKNAPSFAHYIKKIIESVPDDSSLLEKTALYAVELDLLDEAAQLYEQHLQIIPTHNKSHYNYAFVLSRINKPAQAIEHYQKVLDLTPKTHLGLSKALLAIGDYEHGWPEFEWRFPNPSDYHKGFGYHKLRPQDFAGKTVCLRAEWGLGDMIHFIRYAELIKQAGATKIMVQMFAPLVPLFSRCPFLDMVFEVGASIPQADIHIPIMSLPWVFKTTVQTIPAPIPYLFADQQLIQEWKHKLSSDTNFKIGLCWHAKPIYIEDHKHTRRSIPLHDFAPLSQIQGISFYCLQKEYGTDELQHLPQGLNLHDFGDDFDTHHGRFMDTAAVIMNLDLIITADTSIVHAAGALGKPVWVLLPYAPEWRWLPAHPEYATSDTTPWYPHNMRLFKQTKPGNWQDVMSSVQKALLEEIQKRKV